MDGASAILMKWKAMEKTVRASACDWFAIKCVPTAIKHSRLNFSLPLESGNFVFNVLDKIEVVVFLLSLRTRYTRRGHAVLSLAIFLRSHNRISNRNRSNNLI